MPQTVHAVLVLHQPCMRSRCRLRNFKDDVGLLNVALSLSLSLSQGLHMGMRGLANAYSLPSSSKINRSRCTPKNELRE
jgi:hypothetical protein